jgi:hypothetical protein
MLRKYLFPSLVFSTVLPTTAAYFYSQYRRDPSELTNLFEEYKVTKSDVQPCYNKDDFRSPYINFVVKTDIDSDSLPYHEVYAGNPILQENRYHDCRIVCRGETRSPEELRKAGGFNPQFTNPNTRPDEFPKKEDILNPLRHRRSSHGSGLVSFTSDPNIAHSFGKDPWTYGFKFALHRFLYPEYYVYSVKVTGAFGPYFKEHDNAPYQSEYTVPGGAEFDDIACFRKCKIKRSSSNSYTECSSLFFKKSFIEKHPTLVRRVAEANLTRNESCPQLQIEQLDTDSSHSLRC